MDKQNRKAIIAGNWKMKDVLKQFAGKCEIKPK